MVRTPASTHENEISSMIKEDTAHERLAEDEEARRCAWEACKSLPRFLRDQCLPDTA